MIEQVIKYVKTLPPYASIIVLILVIIMLLLSKIGSIVHIVKWIFGKEHRKRSCGDCILILFGIREKYQFERKKIENDLMRSQMKAVEQKIQSVIFFLIESFSEDIKLYGDNATNARKVTEAAFYCETLKNALLLVKDEIRMNFKENGFSTLKEKEYTQYVKERVKIFLMIIRAYLKQYFVETEDTIIKLKERFERLDEEHYNSFEEWTFEVFTNAKDLTIEAARQMEDLETRFKNEIDEFVRTGKSNAANC
jgi:hypothetical protein